jgi:hypothetical protein
MKLVLKKIDPLRDLYNIDLVGKILEEEELRLINLVFDEFDDFNQITDAMEDMISKNVINDFQLQRILKTIKKVVYYKVSLNLPSQEKKSLMRTFFELPEIISKKIHLFIYRKTV